MDEGWKVNGRLMDGGWWADGTSTSGTGCPIINPTTMEILFAETISTLAQHPKRLQWMAGPTVHRSAACAFQKRMNEGWTVNGRLMDGTSTSGTGCRNINPTAMEILFAKTTPPLAQHPKRLQWIAGPTAHRSAACAFQKSINLVLAGEYLQTFT